MRSEFFRGIRRTIIVKMQVKLIATILATLTIAACTEYSVSLNENEVYTPPTLISGYAVPDRTLKECIRNTVRENKVTNVDSLNALICPEGNIENLKGISLFKAIKTLGLAGNNITNIDELVGLQKLTQLDLSDNAIREISKLRSIPSLKRIDLRGNKDLICGGASDSTAQVILPGHCE